MMNLVHQKLKSPVGELTLVARDEKLIAVLWEDDRPGRVKLEKTKLSFDSPVLNQAAQQLQEYFLGERQVFDLPMAGEGTEFQQKVWRALTKIPYGVTASYGELAKKIGSPLAVRAVGAANGRNPLSIVVPCHRVIGANGKLTGFAGGLAAKSFLLSLETNTK
jgi:methylated-DNA-[protein]-cysteine S-methyltransferase